MTQRTRLDFWDVTHEVLHRMRSANGGILCTVGDSGGADNVLTLGWGLIGPSYHARPIFSIAVTPQRHSIICGAHGGWPPPTPGSWCV